MKKRLMIALSAAVAALSLSLGVALAHEGTAIEVQPAVAGPGSTVTLAGEGFEANGQVTVALEGTRGSTPLATVQANAEGTFQTEVVLPDGVSAGSYQIKAVSGDDSASADFSVEPAVASGSTTSASPQEGMTDGGAGTTAGSAVVFKRTAGETIAVSLIMAGLAAAGFILLWGSRRKPRPTT